MQKITHCLAASALLLPICGQVRSNEPPKEQTKIPGLQHSWTWSKAGLAAQISCQASPTGDCHFRLVVNGATQSIQRVPVGGNVLFTFGSNSAKYCAAAEEGRDAPCEERFITAGFHYGR
jgi:hypothetical protein